MTCREKVLFQPCLLASDDYYQAENNIKNKQIKKTIKPIKKSNNRLI